MLSLISQLQIFQTGFLQIQNLKGKYRNCQSLLPTERRNINIYLREFIGIIFSSKTNLSNAGWRLANFWPVHFTIDER